MITQSEVEKKYKENKYGKSKNIELTNMDTKLIRAIYKMKLKYETEMEKKKCIVFLNKAPLQKGFDAKTKKGCKVKDKNEITNKMKELKISEKKKEKIICTAVKMDGKPCTAAAKDGHKFCGRHIKKK